MSLLKKPRIFAVPVHDTLERKSGVDFARIVQPMRHLSKYCHVDIYDISKDKGFDWREIGKKYDYVYFNYLNNAIAFSYMKVYTQMGGCKLVLDIDDALWEMQDDNYAYNVYKKGGEALRNFTLICGEVDYITTTSNYLKNVICRYAKVDHDRVKVFPNYIDLDVYSHRSPFKDAHEIVLTHFGSTSHFKDLEEREFRDGIDRVMKEYPNVKFRTIGAMIPEYRRLWGERYENAFGDIDVHKWVKNKFPAFMDDTDIMVVPLEENIYTRSKSSIKFLEASSAVKPGVWQDIRQYQEVVNNGHNGYLARTARQWYESIKKLIDNKEHRRQVGQNAFDTLKDWTIQGHIKDYLEWFTSLDK